MDLDKQSFEEIYKMACETPLTLVVAFVVAGNIPVQTAEAITRLIVESRGDPKWYELIASSSHICIGG